MPHRRLSVVVTRRLPEVVETRMRELFDVTLNESDAPMDAEALARVAASAEVLVPTVTDRIDQAVVKRGKEGGLKLIANYGAGFDHIDVATAREQGLIVTNTPGVLAEDTADMTMALILAIPRRLAEGMALIQSGKWDGWAPTGMVGRRLGGKRLGIVGMGHVGQAVARRAGGFGLQVHYHDRQRLRPETEEALGATWWESLDQMLARMDIVTVHVPHTPATFHLLSARRLKLMKPSAYLVNTARGEIVDENALTRMLMKRELAGAGLDVFEKEPAVNPRLMNLPNVVLLPHMASATEEGRRDMGEKVILNIKTYADGHRPPDQVLPSML
ncbi:2-hydroxyacid dehydrogenase [Rubrimonas cliftonensis]|uniref:Glyoxylate reductase n=1 Tax=Rubrimonas cliftonensis TaxID=89524 RepID=A0A1H4CNS1_9RHOB|nr:D-glycerate dehydrogenase [Rubrimonas cliftonensis]SEA61963.1 glyoxylate reductase [Rubrimonas cliftonensis]